MIMMAMLIATMTPLRMTGDDDDCEILMRYDDVADVVDDDDGDDDDDDNGEVGGGTTRHYEVKAYLEHDKATAHACLLREVKHRPYRELELHHDDRRLLLCGLYAPVEHVERVQE